MSQIIAESKKEVDYQAHQTMELVEKWQRETCSKFDIIHDYVIRMHNLQNSATEEPDQSSERSVEQGIERKIHRKVEQQADKQKAPIAKPAKRRAEKMIEQPIQGVNGKIQQQNKQKKTVSFPSMPGKKRLINKVTDKIASMAFTNVYSFIVMTALFEDIESGVKPNAVLVQPSPVLPTKSKKIGQRRSTICVASRHPQSDVPDIPMRKKSCLVHSSVLAISKNPSKFSKSSEAQVACTIDGGEKSTGNFIVDIKNNN